MHEIAIWMKIDLAMYILPVKFTIFGDICTVQSNYNKGHTWPLPLGSSMHTVTVADSVYIE